MKFALAFVAGFIFSLPASAQTGAMIADQWTVVGMTTNSDGEIMVLLKKPGAATTLCVIHKPDLLRELTSSVSTRKCFKVN